LTDRLADVDDRLAEIQRRRADAGRQARRRRLGR
jgi:hypothetical protein